LEFDEVATKKEVTMARANKAVKMIKKGKTKKIKEARTDVKKININPEESKGKNEMSNIFKEEYSILAALQSTNAIFNENVTATFLISSTISLQAQWLSKDLGFLTLTEDISRMAKIELTDDNNSLSRWLENHQEWNLYSNIFKISLSSR
jgi:hypothetical protein